MDLPDVGSVLPPGSIDRIGEHAGRNVTVRGWLQAYRSSGSIRFLLIRDGSTRALQAVVRRNRVPPEVFEGCRALSQESAVRVTGEVREEARAPGGYELSVSHLERVSPAQGYPITPKEHGTDFLMDHRHLWIRHGRQRAVLRVRAEIFRAISEWLDSHGFVRVDAPILTPAACEGTTTLFETDYFGERAYLTQSGQLYNEAAAAALGRVYCFGPTFRAEKSKTRRHLMEFWMVEPEMAWCDLEENLAIQEQLVSHTVRSVLERCRLELEELGRDTDSLEKVQPPFPRLTYDEAVEILHRQGRDFPWGGDFGGGDETVLSRGFDRPFFVHRFPARVKAFYMKPDPERPEVVLGADMLAPEGYGEIIGGGQRIDDAELLEQRIREHGLPREAFAWYLDLRRYGSVPHSGFGLGIERVTAWICGLDHVRETIPFPRMLTRIYP